MYYQSKYDDYFPHNIFLEALSDFGVVGCLILLGTGLLSFIIGIIDYKKSGSRERLIILVLIYMYIPYFLLYTTCYSNSLLALMAGYFLARMRRDEEV